MWYGSGMFPVEWKIFTCAISFEKWYKGIVGLDSSWLRSDLRVDSHCTGWRGLCRMDLLKFHFSELCSGKREGHIFIPPFLPTWALWPSPALWDRAVGSCSGSRLLPLAASRKSQCPVTVQETPCRECWLLLPCASIGEAVVPGFTCKLTVFALQAFSQLILKYLCS